MGFPLNSVPKPVAFEVPLDDSPANVTNGSSPVPLDSSIPKKLPPKRLLTLAEQPVQQLTAQQLTEKQLKAEEKRLELLEERKLKAQKYNEKFMSNSRKNSETKSNDSPEHNEEQVQVCHTLFPHLSWF